METIDVHSRSFAIKWIQIPDGVTIMFQLKPIKRSITFGVYRSSQDPAAADKSPYVDGGENGASSSSTSLHRKRSITQMSMEDRLKKSSLVKVQSYGMLNGNEMFQAELKVEKGGIFAFVFDNTFSKSYGKKVLFNKFFVEEIEAKQTPATRKLSVSSSSLNLNNQLHPNNGQYLQGYLLKKKRKKLQGFTKRYFVLNFKYNTLSYYLNEKSLQLRGEMQINLASISAFKEEHSIVIDSGMEVWILKTQNKEDWDNWINALNFIKLTSQKQDDGEEATTNGSLVQPALTHGNALPTKLNVANKAVGARALSQFQATGEIETDKVISELDKRLENLTNLLQSFESKVTPTEYHTAQAELDGLSESVRSLISVAHTPRDLVLSPQMTVFSDDYFDAQDDLDLDGEESLGNQVLLLPGGKNTDAYSVDDLSDQDDISFNGTPSPQLPATNDNDLYPLPLDPVKRRNNIMDSTSTPPSLFSHLRKNVGKDLSSIAMPVTANEPLTILQKMAEMFEHSNLLNDVVQESNMDVKLLKIAMFAIANLGSLRTKERNLRKPFNPILGETYELVNESLGIRMIGEKINHKPQIFAFHCETTDWEISFTLNPEQKFWGKSVELINKGVVTLTFKATGEIYKWQQPSTLLKNIIAGERYTEPINTVTVTSSTGFKSLVEFKKPQSGLFSTPKSEEVVINVLSKDGKKSSLYAEGTWTSEVYMKNTRDSGLKKKIYTASQLLPNEEKKWGFTVWASNLNEITPIEQGHIPITDSRFRPDVRAYENGDIKTAEQLKLEIEQRQRDRRGVLAEAKQVHVPAFFHKTGKDEMSYELIKGEKSYWERRKHGDWEGLLKLW